MSRKQEIVIAIVLSIPPRFTAGLDGSAVPCGPQSPEKAD